MKKSEKILQYVLIFIAIAVAVFVFIHYRQITVENFESSGISWWVWVLIALVVIPIVAFIIQLFLYMPDYQKHQANMAEIAKKMKENTSSWGGARNPNNKHRK
jgi:predicted permease